MNKSEENSVIKYYKTKESLWGYNLILKGVKHFGYYPEGKEKIAIANAQELMSLEIGEQLNLPEDSLVLDAGCGEGPVSVAIAEKYRYRLEGIDLLDFNVKHATERAKKAGVSDKTHFQVGNYSKLDFPDNFFDGVFMIETFVHAPDYKKVLKEIRRVLKPGGKLVIAEYTKSPDEELSAKQKRILEDIIEFSSMPSFRYFINDKFDELIAAEGFTNAKTSNISKRIEPMTKKLYYIAIIPYQIIRLFNLQKHFVNAMWGVYHYPYNKTGIWRYNITTCIKPSR